MLSVYLEFLLLREIIYRCNLNLSQHLTCTILNTDMYLDKKSTLLSKESYREKIFLLFFYLFLIILSKQKMIRLHGCSGNPGSLDDYSRYIPI